MATSRCATEQCERPPATRGLCTLHYSRRRHAEAAPCSIDGCARPATARSWCGLHYKRWQRTGDPAIVTRRSAVADADRFWQYVDIVEDGCWLWLGGINPVNGYGSFNLLDGPRRTTARAHRFAYELVFGPIPEGLEVDHVREVGCIHRHCVRPEHLEAVTHAENVRRSHLPPHCPTCQCGGDLVGRG